MKKLLSMTVAVCMICMLFTTAYAAETVENVVAPLSESNYLHEAIQAHSDKIGMPVEVSGYAIQQDDGFTICSMLVKPQSLAREEALGEYAVDSWFYLDEYIGDVYAIADFEWNNSSAIVLASVYQTGNWNEYATLNVTSALKKNSGLLR